MISALALDIALEAMERERERYENALRDWLAARTGSFSERRCRDVCQDAFARFRSAEHRCSRLRAEANGQRWLSLVMPGGRAAQSKRT